MFIAHILLCTWKVLTCGGLAVPKMAVEHSMKYDAPMTAVPLNSNHYKLPFKSLDCMQSIKGYNICVCVCCVCVLCVLECVCVVHVCVCVCVSCVVCALLLCVLLCVTVCVRCCVCVACVVCVGVVVV